MTNGTDTKIEEMANTATKTISNSKIKTAFIMKKKMDAKQTIKDLTGESINSPENVNYFWNIVSASLAYVKPGTLIY